MSEMHELLVARGAERRVEGAVSAAAASRDGTVLAVGTVEGEIWLVAVESIRSPEAWRVVAAHHGAVLSLVADTGASGFLSGGEDNRLLRTEADGTVTELFRGRRWVDHVASTPSTLAFSTGKQVELRDAHGATTLKTLEHPSTVSAIAFDAKGKRFAASHYNGVSLWFVQAKVDSVRMLEWKGSHIGMALHPAGDAIVTAMQENELHGWRLSDGHNMRMSGYPRQVASMAFTRNGKWLATSGADAVVMWPFFGGGPMGKPPTELARLPGVFCSRVCAHPRHDMIAAGYDDGTILLADTGSERVLPICMSGRGKVSALAFTPQGGFMIFGTEDGWIGAVDLSSQG
ncbi:WD40 repeat domain-containing protein [Acidomonas methanolica]|uniref:Anaphase-promoting complex subunit 4-like WD40 domain-containing protein n=2 Tax=Acidomonas methanolica TaxID=437 RepID=A0A023D2D1_ACIMT|nr:hypothetical protein EDC31_1222 [Acidomonas methanolica]GAJ28219.1 hypothetical protein Amme_016_002 [Acidomonas methanolica NBRC 104435]GEK98788.1 hypothetical protein AME01nite_12870 [Acidomonas methanolica NBRC 104435]